MVSTVQLAGFVIALAGLVWLLLLERDRLRQVWDRLYPGREERVFDDLGPVRSGGTDDEW